MSQKTHRDHDRILSVPFLNFGSYNSIFAYRETAAGVEPCRCHFTCALLAEKTFPDVIVEALVMGIPETGDVYNRSQQKV